MGRWAEKSPRTVRLELIINNSTLGRIISIWRNEGRVPNLKLSPQETGPASSPTTGGFPWHPDTINRSKGRGQISSRKWFGVYGP